MVRSMGSRAWLSAFDSWFHSTQCILLGDFPVAQWVRICLPMLGTRVWSLIWEDSTRRGTTKPRHCNYSAHVLPLLKPAYTYSLCSTARETTAVRCCAPQLESRSRSPQQLESPRSNKDPAKPKVNWKKNILLGQNLSVSWLHFLQTYLIAWLWRFNGVCKLFGNNQV